MVLFKKNGDEILKSRKKNDYEQKLFPLTHAT